MSLAGSTQADRRPRPPRPCGAECAGRVTKLTTRDRVAIDRDRVSPVSCAEGSGVGRPVLRRHSCGTGGRVATGQDACSPALERTKEPGSERNYAAAWRHSNQEAAQERPAKSPCFSGLDGDRGKNSPEIRREENIIQCSAS